MKQKLMLFVTMLFAMMLASCGSETEYAKFIPKEAAVVGRIDVAQIAEKGNFSSNEQLADILKKNVKESGLSSKGKIVAEKILDDPKMTGIDLSKPVFYYYSTDSEGGHGGVVASVLSTSNLKDFLNYLAKENGGDKAKEYNGVTYMADDDVIIAFTKAWCVIKDMESNDEEDVIDALLAREELKPEQTIETDAGYQRMLEGKGLAQLVVRGGMLAQIMSETNNRFSINEAYQDMANFDYVFDLNAENGKLSLDAETYASTEEGRRKLSQNKKFYDEIQGDYADYISKEALFTMVANIHGKEIIKSLENAGFPESQLKDMKPYVDAINGDVVYTLNAIKANLNGLDMRTFARLNNPDPYLQLKSSFSGVPGINEFATNEFSMSLGQFIPTSDLISEFKLADDKAPANTGNILLNFGVNNNRNMYIATSISSNALDKVPTPLEKENYRGRFAYIRFNSTNALDVIKLYAKNTGEDDSYEFKMGMHILGLIDYMELYATTDQKAKLSIVMRDKDKNALATFVGEISNIVRIFN